MVSWVDMMSKQELARHLPRFDVGMMVLANVRGFYTATSPNKFPSVPYLELLTMFLAVLTVAYRTPGALRIVVIGDSKVAVAAAKKPTPGAVPGRAVPAQVAAQKLAAARAAATSRARAGSTR